MMDEKEKIFLEELQQMEKNGVVLRLGEKKSDSNHIVNTIFVKERKLYGNYMRDYIYDEGTLKEVRFDKVSLI